MAAPAGTPLPRPAASLAGRLFLVPTPLDFGCETSVGLAQTLPAGTLQQAATLLHWITENAKSTRAFLKRVAESTPLQHPLQALHIVELPRAVHKHGDHQVPYDARALLRPALDGNDVGLCSEAGMPAVADPGSAVVRAAHDLGIAVVPLIGPVSLLLALAASGLNGQNFAFVGYLPVEAAARRQRILELESLALKTGQAQLFIETPYRNEPLLQALLQHLQHNTRLALASGLTLPESRIVSRLVKDWRQQPDHRAGALPTVFAIGR